MEFHNGTSLLTSTQTISLAEEKAIDSKVSALLEKKAIEYTNASEGFFSNIFPVPMKDGGWRPVIVLHALNTFILQEHFKMDAVVNLKDLVTTEE